MQVFYFKNQSFRPYEDNLVLCRTFISSNLSFLPDAFPWMVWGIKLKFIKIDMQFHGEDDHWPLRNYNVEIYPYKFYV